MVTDLWRVLAKIDTPRLHSFRCEDRNVDFCIYTADDPSTSDKNFVNIDV